MKTKGNFTKYIDNFIDRLSDRQKEVIQKRFGLLDGNRMTLESIGRSKGLTRERIRQIESDALIELRSDLAELEFLVQKLKTKIESFGNICREDKLLEESVDSLLEDSLSSIKKKDEKLKNYVIFLLSLFPYFYYIFEKPENYSVWYKDNQSLEKMKSIHNFFKKELKSINKPLDYNEYRNLIKRATRELGVGSESELLSCLEISKEFKFNPFSEFGLSKWPLINLSSVSDKAYLILKKIGKPMHFSEITDEINKVGFSKIARNTTVHNQLIQDPRFVLYSGGTYVLKEWGYYPGGIKDVLKIILKSGARVKDEIVEKVKEQRNIKEATILLNLKDSNLFKQLPNGKWCLRK
jgi:hypothetical protein